MLYKITFSGWNQDKICCVLLMHTLACFQPLKNATQFTAYKEYPKKSIFS